MPSLAQRLILAVMPRRLHAEIEAHSRQWMVRCPECGTERSVWELGGVRWRAAGKPRWYRRCIGCGRRVWHEVYRRS